jgi:hypothetical protein
VSPHEGVSFYVGMTGTGKTYLALQHLREAVAENGFPALILDLVRAKNLRDLPHEPSVDAVLDKLYGSPRTHATFTPTEEQTDQLMRAISDDLAGGVNVLVDEIYWVPCNARKISTDFSKALRSWRHPALGENRFFLTSQRPGDLHGDGYAARSRMYVFRPSEGRDVDRLERDFGIPREEMLALKAREFKLVSSGIAS